MPELRPQVADDEMCAATGGVNGPCQLTEIARAKTLEDCFNHPVVDVYATSWSHTDFPRVLHSVGQARRGTHQRSPERSSQTPDSEGVQQSDCKLIVLRQK